MVARGRMAGAEAVAVDEVVVEAAARLGVETVVVPRETGTLEPLRAVVASSSHVSCATGPAI